jgi:DNA polymerase-3 subunit beta
MKLVTTALQLRSALNLFRTVIEPRNTYPVLGTVLFDGATIRGTNLDQELVVSLVASEAKGIAAIDFRTLSRLVALIPGDDTVTIAGGKDEASISFSSGRYDLPCCDTGAFPVLNGSTQGAIERVDATGMLSALRFVAPTISQEATRYYLNGFSFQDSADGSALVTTNGHQLAVAPFKTPGHLHGVIVPRQAASTLLKLVEPARIERIARENWLRFAWPGMTLTTKLVEGTFPDWKRVVPRFTGEDRHHLSLDRKELVTALFRVGAIGARRGGPATTLAYGPAGAILSAVNLDHGTAREFLSSATIESDHDDHLVSFRSDYMLTLLRNYSGHERVTVDIIDASSPMRVSAGEGAYTLLMPMRGGHEKLALEVLHELSPMGRAA